MAKKKKKKKKQKSKPLKGHVKRLGDAAKSLDLAARELKKTHKSLKELCQDGKVIDG